MTFIDDDEVYETVAQRAATWIRHPEQMLADLTSTYNELVGTCVPVLVDGARIILKPEYRDPMLVNICGITIFQSVIETLEIVERFDAARMFSSNVIVAVRDAMLGYTQSTNGTEFDSSMREFQAELNRLARWVECRRLLNQPESSDHISAAKKPSATFDDVVRAILRVKAENGGKATKDRILNALRGEGFTIGSDLFQKYRTAAEKQSAVRPPE